MSELLVRARIAVPDSRDGEGAVADRRKHLARGCRRTIPGTGVIARDGRRERYIDHGACNAGPLMLQGSRNL